jgi:alpha-ketoglutarate-dependent taurine dioxygenase
MEVTPLSGSHGFGVRVEVSDPDSVDPETLVKLWKDNLGLMLLHGYVTAEHPERLIRLGEMFGDVNHRPKPVPPNPKLHTDQWPDDLRRYIQVGFDDNVVANNGPDMGIITLPPAEDEAGETPLQWHTDQSFTTQPAKATCFFCVSCPASGADTLFVNTALALDRLE